MSNIAILIVDDEIKTSEKERKLFDELVKHIPESTVHSIDFFKHEKGTQITDEELEKTKLALIDVMLPTKNAGFSLMDRLKEKGIKTIAISNKADSTDAFEASKHADEFWKKDESDFQSLIDKITALLTPVKRKDYCAFEDNTCFKEFCDRDRHSIFIATSCDNTDFAIHIKNALGKQYNVDPWTKNSADAELLFCDKVCPKIYGNMLLIAEISDLKPNVFFEAGLGLGLGRIVFLAKRKGIEQPNSCFLNALYYKEYEQISKLTTSIKEKLEDEKVECKSLRDIKLPSSLFDNLQGFNESKISNVGRLLLGAENESLCKVKSYLESNGIPNIDIMNIHSYKGRVKDVVRSILKHKIIIGIIPNFEEGKPSINLMDACEVSMLLGFMVAQNIDVRVLSSNIVPDYQEIIYSKEDLKKYSRTTAI